MGIRIVCPNGHQLNVKDHLAGKRGICPHCQARFEIPVGEAPAPAIVIKPAPAPVAQPARRGIAARPGSPAASVTPPSVASATPTGTVPIFAIKPAAPAPTATSQPAPAMTPAPTQISAPGPVPTLPPAPVVAPAPAPVVVPTPPAVTVPEVIWYVRPATGGQYGPADQTLMQQWITEGRVPPDAMVWRTGWNDWLRADVAGEHLPGALVASAAARPITIGRPVDDRSLEVAIAPESLNASSAANAAAATAAARLQRKRRAAARAQAWIAAILFILAISLCGVLVYILNRGEPAAKPPANSPPAAPATTTPAATTS